MKPKDGGAAFPRPHSNLPTSAPAATKSPTVQSDKLKALLVDALTQAREDLGNLRSRIYRESDGKGLTGPQIDLVLGWMGAALEGHDRANKVLHDLEQTRPVPDPEQQEGLRVAAEFALKYLQRGLHFDRLMRGKADEKDFIRDWSMTRQDYQRLNNTQEEARLVRNLEAALAEARALLDTLEQ